MRRRAPVVGSIGLGLATLAAALAPALATKLYKGPWFEVRYPAEFVARKSLPDSAFFRSKDGSVEFYVFGPQWNGEPSDVALDERKETLVARSEQKTKRGSDAIVVRRMTCKAKNGSYARSVEDTENTTLNTRHAFGIRYRDSKTLAKWRQAYLAFKASLEQFAD